MSDLLLDGRLVAVQPALVRRIGLLEAALVQQLHYWTQRATCVHDGQLWVYKTYNDWSDEIGVSAKAARGALDRLRREGIVVAIDNPADARDRTLWWRIDYARLIESPPSAPAGRPTVNCPDGHSASAPAGSSTRARPDAVHRAQTKTTSRSTAREDLKNQVPDGFPDELRPHAREVLRILRSVTADHPTCKQVWPREVGLAVMAFPRRPLVATAHELAGWAVDPPRVIRNAAQTYRTFLGKTRDLAATERLAGDGTPSTEPRFSTGNVHQLRPMSNADVVDQRITELRAQSSSLPQ